MRLSRSEAIAKWRCSDLSRKYDFQLYCSNPEKLRSSGMEPIIGISNPRTT